MDQTTTEDAVADARAWAVERLDADIHMDDVRAIYEEFEEWIELDGDKGGLEIMSLEALEEYYID